MMKVSVIGTRGFPNVQGGVEKHCEKLYTSMSNDISLIIFRRKAFIGNNKKSIYPNIKFIDIASTKIKGFESFFHSFISTCICLITKPDIVHIHNIGPGLFTFLLKLRNIPVVLTYHSPNYEHKKWGFLARKILVLGEKLALKYSDYIIFVNKYQRAKFPNAVQTKSAYIPNGVEIKQSSNQTDYIQSIGLTTKKYLLTVGRITQEKGFDYLIESFLSLKLEDYKLVIAGGADHKQNYASTLLKKAQDNRIITTGFIEGEALHQLYSNAFIFILPSFNEGFPLVLLEAMSYNLPIIASDIKANQQLGLSDDCFFKTGDKICLANKIKENIDTPKINCQYDLEYFNWNRIVKQVENIYRSIYSISNKQ